VGSGFGACRIKEGDHMIGILGGGLGGVSLQYFLDRDSEILERENQIGGLCRTFEKDGFYYDIGGHILFSKNTEFLSLAERLLESNGCRRRRANQVLYQGRYVKYPFENGLGGLEKEDAYECLIHYLDPKPDNFKQWIYYTFGNGIAKKYLIPYNIKSWKYPLEQMGLEWVERVPRPPLSDVVKSALGIETEGYTHQLNFIYPCRGGIASFVEAFQKDAAKITTHYKITEVKKINGGWSVSDGISEKKYDRLVSTLPLHEMIQLLKDIPEEVKKAVSGLRYNSLRIVLVGISNESLNGKSAVYIPDPGILPHRICFMGYFSRAMVPSGKSSLIAEISTFKGEETYKISDSALIEKVIGNLHGLGILNPQEVTVTDCRKIEYAYVVYDSEYTKKMRIVREFFASSGIDLLGRFAEFEYINMDEVVSRSLRLAEKLNQI
jgi:protoporphyrinogen oxidase